jgi:transposase-like protein
MSIAMEPSPALTKLTSEDRRRILEEYDSYPRGDARRGALLRRYGLYTSQVAKWRERRKRGQTDLSPQAPGPKPQPADPLATEVARLTRENARLQAELDKATLIIDVQKKIATLLGMPASPASADPSS